MKIQIICFDAEKFASSIVAFSLAIIFRAILKKLLQTLKKCGPMTFSFVKQCPAPTTNSLRVCSMVEKSWIRHWYVFSPKFRHRMHEYNDVYYFLKASKKAAAKVCSQTYYHRSSVSHRYSLSVDGIVSLRVVGQIKSTLNFSTIGRERAQRRQGSSCVSCCVRTIRDAIDCSLYLSPTSKQ